MGVPEPLAEELQQVCGQPVLAPRRVVVAPLPQIGAPLGHDAARVLAEEGEARLRVADAPVLHGGAERTEASGVEVVDIRILR